MYTAIFLSATAGKTYNTDVGYGDGNAGALIDLKDFTGDPSDENPHLPAGLSGSGLASCGRLFGPRHAYSAACWCWHRIKEEAE